MAAGDIYIRRNGAEVSTLPNTGTNLDLTWDTEALTVGTARTYSAGNITLPVGMYMIYYSEKFQTGDTTNNERITMSGEIHVSGTGAIGGFSGDYIRKSSGQQECIVSASTFHEVTSGTDDIFIRVFRTDNSTSGIVSRVANTGGIIIVEIDSTDEFGFYSTSASENTSGATERILNINTNDRQDTGFSRSGSGVTVTGAGRYLAMYSIDISTTGTGREDVVGRITNAGTEITGTNSYCYLRGGDASQDGGLNWAGIIDLAGGEVLDVRWQAPQSATITGAAGATFQIWRIPSAGDTCIMEATTGNYNASGQFTWDTLPHIDTASFTATAGTSAIQTNQGDYLLSFATFHNNAPDSPQRAYPEVRMRVNGTNSNQAAAGMYHRNSGGSGICAVNVCDLVSVAGSGLDLEVNITPVAAGGAVNNDSGQFSVLSLNSLYGPYTFPPSISNIEDEQFAVNETNIVLDGSNFEAVQGTGVLEVGDSSDYATATKVTQSIDSWSDTQIVFDLITTGIGEGTIYFWVTNDTGDRSPPYQASFGLPAYHTIVQNLGPDHFWTFNNTYDDEINTNDFTNSVIGGGGGFETNPICEQNTHSWAVRVLGDRRECANSNQMNGQTETNRLMGGWVRFDSIQTALSCIYEEGGGVNNLAFYIGMGNILITALADTSDDNVQAYSDFALAVNRPYHILFRFSYTETTKEFRLYIDGVKQQVTDGNPLLATDLDSHSGDISIGGPGGNLEVGGTDVLFATQSDTLYACWASWDNAVSDADIETLFRRGAIPEDILSPNTQANMQTDLDTYADTVRADAPLSFRINPSTDQANGDVTLTADNIVFDDRISMTVEWRGTGTLTWINENGSNLVNDSRIYTPNGGTVVVQESVPITITVQDIDTKLAVQDARVFLETDSGGPLAAGTNLINALTDVNGQTTTNLLYSADQPVTGRVRKGSSSTYYQTAGVTGTVTTEGLNLTILLIKDE